MAPSNGVEPSASGASSMSLGRSITSKTRSNETNEVTNSTLLLEMADSGPYSCTSSPVNITITPRVIVPWMTM